MHILITGERQAGKSFLIRRLLQEEKRPLYGFVTKMEPEGAEGLRYVYMHPAAQKQEDWVYTRDNLVGVCDKKGARAIYPETFDTLGVSLLQQAQPRGLIIMDELGYMESTAPLFTQQVLTLLAGDIPVLAAVKKRPDVPFLEEVWHTGNAFKYTLTEKNREELYQTIAYRLSHALAP